MCQKIIHKFSYIYIQKLLTHEKLYQFYFIILLFSSARKFIYDLWDIISLQKELRDPASRSIDDIHFPYPTIFIHGLVEMMKLGLILLI